MGFSEQLGKTVAYLKGTVDHQSMFFIVVFSCDTWHCDGLDGYKHIINSLQFNCYYNYIDEVFVCARVYTYSVLY